MSSAFKLTVDGNGIGTLTFDLPSEKVNKLSPDVMKEFESVVDSLAQRKDIKALLIKSGKEDTFIAGADIKSFLPILSDPSLAKDLIGQGHRAFDKLQALPFPTIAVIHGTCLGGGMELALACTYRIVTDHPKTVLGLPEVNLGIIPGWGGTQRMPRLVGLTEGLGLILPGKTVKADKAYKLKLADAIVAPEFRNERAQEFVESILKDPSKVKGRRKRGGVMNFLLEGNPLGRAFVISQARKELLKKTKGKYPSPLLALKAVEEGFPKSLAQGLEVEKRLFDKNLSTAFVNAPYLIQLFFDQETVKKETYLPNGEKPRQLKNAAVLGAGTMGGGIAWLFANNSIPVRIKDINWDAIAKGYATAADWFKGSLKRKQIKPSDADLRLHMISSTTDYSGFEHADIVVEAVTENLDLKKKIFSELEGNIRDDAIIASNTSSLTIDEMSKDLKKPERFVGMHFFNPVNRMPLVEVVAGSKTSPQAVAATVEVCKKMGKMPIVVGDCAGFLVNRIFVPAANEVMFMLQEGVPMDKISKRMLDFGLPMDPFELGDEVGNDVSVKVTKTFEKAYGDRMKGPAIMDKVYDKKLFGKKVGKGFYIYDGKDKKLNPEIKELVGNVRDPGIPEQDIEDRVIYLMINEAARCMDEGIVKDPNMLDLAMIMGIGFPPFRGGVLRYANKVGLQHVVDRLNEFAKKYGKRFEPAPKLVEIAKAGKQF